MAPSPESAAGVSRCCALRSIQVRPPEHRSSITLRRATSADQRLLDEVLWMAHTWRETPHPPMPQRLPEPICRYSANFGRTGDHGVVALLGGVPAGAAWWRHRSADDPGYGYLAADTPELTIGVRPEHRRQGVATAILAWLVREAATQKLAAMSLSVEADNPAKAVYRRAGFVVVDKDDGALTMRLVPT